MRTNYGICIRVWVYRPMLRYICYYSTLMTAFLQAKKHRNTPQARLRPTSPALRATSPCRGGFGIPQIFPSSPEAPLPGELSSAARLRGCTLQQLLSKHAKSPPQHCEGLGCLCCFIRRGETCLQNLHGLHPRPEPWRCASRRTWERPAGTWRRSGHPLPG